MSRLRWALGHRLAPQAMLAAFLIALPALLPIPNADFNKAYYPAARQTVETGTFAYTYEGFKNLPVVALLLAPFALTDRDTGGHLFLVFQLLAYFAAFHVLAGALARSSRDRWALLALFVLSTPFLSGVRFGQLTSLAFLLLVSMLALYLRGGRTLPGVLLGSAFLLKIPTGFLFLYFLRRGELRVMTASALTFLGFLAASLLFYGLELHFEYYEHALAKNAGKTLLAYNNQNLFAFVMRFVEGPAHFSWATIAIPRALELGLLSGIAAFVALVLALWCGPTDDSRKTEIGVSLMICIMLSVFPFVWDHYYLFLVLPFFVAYRGLEKSSTLVQIACYVAAFAFVNLPLVAILKLPALAASQASPLVAGLPFLGCLILLALLVREARRLGTLEPA